MLGDNEFQLQVIDILAGNKQLREEYKQTYSDYLKQKRQLADLKEKSRTQSGELDYIRFQFSQLEDAKLQADEQKMLEQESEILSHIEEIKNGLYSIEQFLTEEEKGIVLSLKSSLNIAESLKKVFPSANEITERLQSAFFDLNDLVQEINRQNEKMELDPERLQWINDRLSLIYTLQKKHNVETIEELITLKENLGQQLQEIENFDEEVEKLEKILDLKRKEVLSQAKELSETRKKAIQSFENELIAKVSVLGMPAMKFLCDIREKEFPDSKGADEINFLFSANKNGELKPVSQTASGGEISRLMLGIKALIAGATALPTIIFDEIDTGVSGEIADKMGAIMRQMGEVMQVIVITHLPQIAAKGNAQYFVYKEEHNEYTETSIRRLSDKERIMEIAQMLSGSELTDAAIENAKELLK